MNFIFYDNIIINFEKNKNMIWQKEIMLGSYKRGIHLITNELIDNLTNSHPSGLLNIFLKHTSAAIIINENSDPLVRNDFNNFLNYLVPDNYKEFTHVFEGKDDMSAHIKSSILGQTINIPIVNGKLGLGIWQGIYLCEFREHGSRRKIVLTIYS